MRYAMHTVSTAVISRLIRPPILVLALICGLLPLQAQAAESCNAAITIKTVLGPDGGFFEGDLLTLKGFIGAGRIVDDDRPGTGADDKPYIDFTGIGYGLDCGSSSTMSTLSDCKPVGLGDVPPAEAGHQVEFEGVSYSNCPTDIPGVPAEWPPIESNNIVAIPVINEGRVVRQYYDPILAKGETCQVDVAFRVNKIFQDETWVTQALGVPFDNRTPLDPVDDMKGTCSNAMPASGYGKAVFQVNRCGIEVIKEVSVDGENWFDANSESEAPKLPADGTAYYRLLVKNTSTVDYVGNLHVVDPILDIDTWITPDFDENGEMVIGGPGSAFELAEFCADVVEDQDLFLTNTATVEGTCRASDDPGLRVLATDSDIAVVNCLAKPRDPLTAVVIQKYTNGDDADSPTGPYVPVGDSVTWSYQVTNVGEEGITIDSVSDNMEGAVTCPGDVIDPGQTVSCTSISGTAAEGQYANVATVFATGAQTGNTANDSDPSHYFGLQASIDLVKTPDPETYAAVGDSITYTFAVTNTSNVALANVYVTDPLPGLSDISCPATELAIGASMDCTASYSITQADMDAGQVDNTATAYGTAPNGQEVSDSDSAQVTTSVVPTLSLVKTALPLTYTAAGQGIAYTYVLTNSGKVTLYPPYSVADDKTVVSCPQDDDALQPGEQVVCTATYTILDADVVAKSVTNIAQGQAFDVNTSPVLSNQDQQTVYYAGLTVLKEILDDGDWVAADDADSAPVRFWPAGAAYRITVENVGAVALDNVTITDTKLGLEDEPVNGGTLAVGEKVTVTGDDFAVLNVETACDASGEFSNTALASATTVLDGTPVSDSDMAWLVCVGTPEVTVKKYISIDGGVTWVDDTAGPVDAPSGALYKITVSNSGNVDLVDVMLDDSLIPGSHTIDSLGVGDSVDVTSGEWSELDMTQVCGSSGLIQNTVTATATSADRDSDQDTDTDSAWLECIGPPQIGILKEVSLDGGTTWLDASVEPYPTALYDPETDVPALYRITVGNIGAEPLTNVVVSDSTLGIDDYLVGDLAVGASVVIDSGTLAALSVASLCDSTGEKANVAYAIGETETGTSDQASDDAVVVCVGAPAIQVLKEVSNDGISFSPTNVTMVAPNDAWYRFTVTNIGNVALENVVINDAILGIVDFVPSGAGGPGTLAVGESVVIAHANAGDNTLFDLYVPGLCSSDNLGETINTVIADGESVASTAKVSDEDSVTVTCEEPFDICEAYNRPGTLTLEYNGTSSSDNSQINDTAVPQDVDLPPLATIKLYDKGLVKATYENVPIGYDEILVEGKWTASGFIPTTVKVEIYDGDVLKQTITFHGSCSEPLLIGDKFGGVTIVKATQGKDE